MTAAAFKKEPTADVQPIEVTEHIVIVGKKQFDMTMGGNQESDSASSLTMAITNVKIESPDQGTILKDTNTSQSSEGPENATDMTTPRPGLIADEQEVPSANDGMSAMVSADALNPNAQTAQPKPTDTQVNPIHVNYMLNLPCTLTDQLSILDDTYAMIMDMFFLHIRVRYAESLGDLNTCQAAVNKAIQNWTDAMSRQTGLLGSFPRVSSYNQAVDNLRLCSQALWQEINYAEREYLDQREKHAGTAAKAKATWKEMVQTGVSQAIHHYLQSTGWAIILHLSPNRNRAPWLAQVTARNCNFQLTIMTVVADYLDIPIGRF